MIPDPLHPAVVHLPIALAIVTPLIAGVIALAVRRDLLPVRSWVLVLLLQALLVGSGWVALETGEEQHDRVAKVTGHRPVEEHQEAAERFLTIAAIGLVISLAGLRWGPGRAIAILASAVVLGAAVPVGRLGGELVYRHGAASAYVQAGAAARDAPHEEGEEHPHDED